MLIRGYDVPSIVVVPHLSTDEISEGDPLWCMDRSTTEDRLVNSFSKLCKVKQRLREYYFDKFLLNLQHQSAERPNKYKTKNHVLLGVGDLVAIKCKFTKPYSYHSGIVRSVELMTLMKWFQ
jgi:hypothetical protein